MAITTSQPLSVVGGAECEPAPRPALMVFHIDDSADDRTLFQMACEQAGVPITCQGLDSAAKAMARLEALLGQSKTQPVTWPDLVLLDIVMPGRTGFEMLQFLRSTPQLQRIPVIAFTGDVNPEVKNEAYRCGANSYLRKPLSFSETRAVAQTLYEAWSLTQRPSPPG